MNHYYDTCCDTWITIVTPVDYLCHCHNTWITITIPVVTPASLFWHLYHCCHTSGWLATASFQNSGCMKLLVTFNCRSPWSRSIPVGIATNWFPSTFNSSKPLYSHRSHDMQIFNTSSKTNARQLIYCTRPEQKHKKKQEFRTANRSSCDSGIVNTWQL